MTYISGFEFEVHHLYNNTLTNSNDSIRIMTNRAPIIRYIFIE